MNKISKNVALEAFEPVQVNERLELIDILRTFALLGIFITNIQFYQEKSNSPINETANWLIHIFIDGSFYPLFSLLFGIGFMIFLNRARINEKQGNWLYIRRLFFLSIIAALQFVLLEPRHILFRYVMLGVPLIIFQNASKKVLIWSISALIVISIFHNQIIHSLENLRRNTNVTEQVVQEKEVQKDFEQQAIAIEGFNQYTKRNIGLLYTLMFELIRHPSLPRILTFF